MLLKHTCKIERYDAYLILHSQDILIKNETIPRQRDVRWQGEFLWNKLCVQHTQNLKNESKTKCEIYLTII